MVVCVDGFDEWVWMVVKIFIKVLGIVCGNLLLIQLLFGGVYLVGGVVCVIIFYLYDFDFGEVFCDKGCFVGFMLNFVVYVVEDDYVVLIGCVVYLENM